MSAVWITVAAVGLTLALLFSLRAFLKQRKRKAVETMKEQPWSPEALALLAESVDLDEQTEQDAGPRTSIERAPEEESAARVPPSTQLLLDEVIKTAGQRADTGAPMNTDTPEAGSTGSVGLEAATGKNAQKELEGLLYRLPLQAGNAEIGRALEKIALSALGYYQYGLLQDSPDLPINVTSDASTSLSPDTSMVAGYLELERRMGRLPADLHPAETASTLLGAVAARALGIGGVRAVPEKEFVQAAVSILLKGELFTSPTGEKPLDEATVPDDPTDTGPLRWRAGGRL